MSKDLIKPTRGLSSEMNKLQANELGFATDTKQLFIGTGDGAEPTLIKGEKGEKGDSETIFKNWTPGSWALDPLGRFTGEPDGSVDSLENLYLKNLFIPDARGDHDLLTISITEYIKGIAQALARGVYKLSESQSSIQEGWVCVKNDTGNTISTINGYTGADLTSGRTYIIYMYYTYDEFYDVIYDLGYDS